MPQLPALAIQYYWTQRALRMAYTQQVNKQSIYHIGLAIPMPNAPCERCYNFDYYWFYSNFNRINCGDTCKRPPCNAKLFSIFFILRFENFMQIMTHDCCSCCPYRRRHHQPVHNHLQKHQINAQINTRSTFNVFAHKKRIMHSLSHYSILSYK